MEIKLAVSNERYEEIKNVLLERGITVSDSADLVLYESNRFADNLIVKGQDDGSRYVVPVSEIIISGCRLPHACHELRHCCPVLHFLPGRRIQAP